MRKTCLGLAPCTTRACTTSKLVEHGFEAEELTVAQELTQVPEFVDTVDNETTRHALMPTAAAAAFCEKPSFFMSRCAVSQVWAVPLHGPRLMYPLRSRTRTYCFGFPIPPARAAKRAWETLLAWRRMAD